jgi:hypothetical protein
MSLHAQSLALGAADYTWRNEALCRDTDPELFFPVGNTGDAIGQIELARTVCNDCQVRSQCLEFAIAVCGAARARTNVVVSAANVRRCAAWVTPPALSASRSPARRGQ